MSSWRKHLHLRRRLYRGSCQHRQRRLVVCLSTPKAFEMVKCLEDGELLHLLQKGPWSSRYSQSDDNIVMSRYPVRITDLSYLGWVSAYQYIIGSHEHLRDSVWALGWVWEVRNKKDVTDIKSRCLKITEGTEEPVTDDIDRGVNAGNATLGGETKGSKSL